MPALLESVLDFANARIAVLGDVMLDRFVFGDVDRISPEAPVPVLRVSRETSMPGGAGNLACNIARMGDQVTLIQITREKRQKFFSQRYAVFLLQADCSRRQARLWN